MWRNFPTASPHPIRSREGQGRPEGARLQRRPAGDAASVVSLDPFGLIRPLPGLPTKGSGAAFAVISPRVPSVSPWPCLSFLSFSLLSEGFRSASGAGLPLFVDAAAKGLYKNGFGAFSERPFGLPIFQGAS